MVAMHVSTLQDGTYGRWTWFLSMLIWRLMAHITARCFWLKSWCLSCLRSWDLWRDLHLPARQCCCSLSARGTTHLHSFHQTFYHRTSQIWTRFVIKYGRNAAAGLASSWRWWTEAALNRCLASFRVSVIDDAVDKWRKCLCAWYAWKEDHSSI